LEYLTEPETESLTTSMCTAVVNTLGTMKKIDWKCNHMKYLVSNSYRSGSGIAKRLSCNLSDFDWKIILSKEGFDTDLMKMLCSLNAQLSDHVLKDIVTLVHDKYPEILNFALNKVKSSLSKEIKNSLCKMTLTKKKKNFFLCLVKYGADINLEELLKIFSPAIIMSQKTLCNVIKSNSQSCNDFMQYCLRSGDVQAVNYCKSIIQDVSKDQIDMAGLIQAAIQSNKDNGHTSFNFVKWLLHNKHLDPKNIHKAHLSEQHKAILLENVMLNVLQSG